MAVLASQAVAVGTRLDSGTDTGEKPQSKIFHHDGAWWAIADGSDGVAFYEKNGNNWDRAPFLDGVLTSSGRPDVKWNGTYLFVLVYTSSPKLYKYTYDSSLRSFNLQSGFPVTVPRPSGAETMVLEQDSTGRLWVAAEGGNDINVYYTTTNDHKNWSSVINLQSGVGSDDICTIIAFGGDKVGVFWSDQNRDEFGFRVHQDGDSPSDWASKEIANSGNGNADDHLNAAYDSQGRVFVITKDDSDEMAVHRRSTNGNWTTEADILGVDGTRGILMLDEDNNRLYALYTRWGVSPNRIEMLESDMDNMNFGSRSTYLSAGSHMNNVTGTKQILPDGTMVAIAHASGSMFWNADGTVPEGSGPSAPQDIIATLTGSPVRVDINWNAPSTGSPSGYNIYRQIAAGNFLKINGSPVGGTSFSDTSPAEDNLCYRITAIDGSESGASNVDCVDNTPVTPPSQPLNLISEALSGGATGTLALPMDEGNGQIAGDITGSGNDARLGSTTLADSGDPLWIAGVDGSALQFDGFDDYLYVPHSSSLDMNGSFTISAWMRQDTPTTGTLVNKGTSGNRTFRILVNGSGGVEFRWEDVNSDRFEVITSPVMTLGTWHHIACVYDKDANENRIYVDGVLQVSGYAAGIPADNTKQMHVGARLSSTLKDFFGGAIDQLHITTGVLYTENFVIQPGGTGGPMVVRLQWQEPTSGGFAASYDVFRSVNFGPYQLLNANPIASGTSYIDSNLLAGELCYQVVGLNAQSEAGPPSNSTCETIAPLGPQPPPVPTDLSVQLAGSAPENAILNWTAPDSGTVATGYNIYRSVESGAYQLLTAIPVTTTSFTDTNLLGGLHCYQVSAVDIDNNEGELTSAQCVSYFPPPPPPPAAPLNVAAATMVQSGTVAVGTGAWLFDEGSGLTTADATGNGNSGRLGSTAGTDANDPTWSAGIEGGALLFDGTNDFVEIADSPGMQLPGSFTIEAWINRASSSGSDVVLAKGDSDQRNYWMRIGSSGIINFRWETANGANHGTKSSATISLNTWHHIACVYDMAAGEDRIYIDGVLVKTSSDSGIPATSTDPVHIGTRLSSGSRKDYFHGMIDLVRVTPSALYDADFAPPTTYSDDGPTVTQLTWSPSASSGVVGYNIYRSVANAPFQQLNSTLVADTTWVDTATLTDSLCYIVRAVDFTAQVGPDSDSACVDINGPPPPTPEAPGAAGSLTTALLGTDPETIGLTWQVPTTGLQPIGYNIYRSVNGGNFELQADSTTTTTWTDSTLVAGDMCYQVTAFDSLGREGTLSDSSCVTYTPPIGPPPSEPRNVIATLTTAKAGGTGPLTSAASGNGAWAFDEGSGDTATDATGNGHDAQLGNSVGVDSKDPTWVPGLDGTALQFAGSQFASIADAPDLRFAGSFTIEAWVYRTSGSGAQVVMSKGDSDKRNHWLRIRSGGDVDFRWETASGANRGTRSSGSIPLNEWHHIACLYDMEAGENRIYIDGVLDKTASDSGTPTTSADPLLIGTRLSSGSKKEYFVGRIDLARVSAGAIYSTDFTPETTFGPAPLQQTVQLTWDAPLQGIPAGYRIYRSIDSAAQQLLTATLITNRFWADSNPVIGLLTYHVSAVDAFSQEGPQSTDSTAVQVDDGTPPPPAAPSQPLNLVANLEQLTGGATGSAAFRLDEGTGQIVGDASGNGNNGYLGSTAGVDTSDPLWTTGFTGSALLFDGANDRVTIPDSPDLRMTGSFTIEAWVYRAIGAKSMVILSKGDSDQRNYWLRIGSSGTVDFRWEVAGGGNRGTKSSATMSVGQWQHVACLYDIVAGKSRIYIDGLLVKESSDSGTPVTSSDPLHIGTRLSGGSLKEFHNGMIDLVRITPDAIYSVDFTPPTGFGGGAPITVAQMSWSAPASGSVNGYNVYRSANSGPWTLLTAQSIGQLAFTDAAPLLGSNCYEITAVDGFGQEGAASDSACVTRIITKVAAVEAALAAPWNGPQFGVHPNPFNPQTRIEFNLPESRQVDLRLYDVRGRQVRTLLREQRSAGLHIVRWDGRSNRGLRAGTGTYFIVLQAGDIRETRKLIILK